MAVAGGGGTPKKAGLRRRALSGNGCGAASPMTPTSCGRGASPRTPTSGGRASPRTPNNGASAKTPTSGAASLLRRHSGTPKKPKTGSPLVRGFSSCPLGWAPVCAVRAGGKGSPLRRGRTGSDTPAASNHHAQQKKILAMPSYKSRTPADSKSMPRPRIIRQNTNAPNCWLKADHQTVKDYQEPLDVDSEDAIQLIDSEDPRQPKLTAKRGKAYGHGKRARFWRLQKEILKGSFNG